MFDLRTLAHVPWPGLAATDCHLLCHFDSRSNFAANPAGACVVFLLQTSASLSVFKKKPTVWPAHLLSSDPTLSRFPTQNRQRLQYPPALKHPVCRPEISGKILKIRCNS
jgi:hypothetical protein